MKDMLLISDLKDVTYRHTCYIIEKCGNGIVQVITKIERFNIVNSTSYYAVGEYSFKNKRGRVLLNNSSSYKEYKNFGSMINALIKSHDYNCTCTDYKLIAEEVKKELKEQVKNNNNNTDNIEENELSNNNIVVDNNNSNNLDKIEDNYIYSCHFKCWNLDADTIERLLNIAKIKYTNIIDDKFFFEDLDYVDMLSLKKVVDFNESILFIDSKIYINSPVENLNSKVTHVDFLHKKVI